LRAYASDDGDLLWEFDTAREFETVSGLSGKGGALDSSAPVVANGLLLVNSGYGAFGQMPGNVLLAFRPRR
jgi:polyvinyl alcohol dehydrogenase (cytochrome)